VGKSALLLDFIKAYAADGIEDYLEEMICYSSWMGEKRGEKGGKSDDRGQREDCGLRIADFKKSRRLKTEGRGQKAGWVMRKLEN